MLTMMQAACPFWHPMVMNRRSPTSPDRDSFTAILIQSIERCNSAAAFSVSTCTTMRSSLLTRPRLPLHARCQYGTCRYQCVGFLMALRDVRTTSRSWAAYSS